MMRKEKTMTNNDFYEMLKKMVEEEEKTMVSKGREYTVGSDDKLANFKDVAKNTGLTPMQVWAVYFLKHIASICNYVKDGREASNEPIQGRIMDARNYLALLRGLIEEYKERINNVAL
jgi:hypothetical protein